MNPSPAPRPVSPPPWLIDRRITPPSVIHAAIIRGFSRDRLAEVEQSWGPARDALAVTAQTAGTDLENRCWNWRNKVQAYPPGWHCFVAVEYDGQVQGLMAVKTQLRSSRLNSERWALYVDFVEAAPWNLRLPAIQEPRFGGVGTLLIGEAVRMSFGRAANGRVGLHALPKAEDFYDARCKMTRIGPDPDYHNLVYFEYPDNVAAEWLTDVGLSA